MTEGWTCQWCSTANVEASLICARCGSTRPDDAPAAPPMVLDGVPADAPPAEAPADGPPVEPPPGDGTRAATPPPAATEGLPGWLPQSGQSPVTASAPAPLWRRIPVGWLVVAVFVVGAGVVGWYFNASRSASGEITKAGDLTASDLRMGDCFDLKDPSADTVEDVTATPCSAQHEYEVIFVGSLPGGDYPAETAFEAYAQDNCQTAFGAYVGKTFDDSELEISWFFPTDDAWRSGDRSVQCAAYHPRIHRLTESLKGSQR